MVGMVIGLDSSWPRVPSEASLLGPWIFLLGMEYCKVRKYGKKLPLELSLPKTQSAEESRNPCPV